MKLIAIAMVFTLTACAGIGVGVGSYKDDEVKAYYIGIGIKSESLVPDLPSLPTRPNDEKIP